MAHARTDVLSGEVAKGFGYHKSDVSHIYVNPGVLPQLARLDPDCVIIDSFSPTMLTAGLYAVAAGKSLGLAVEGARDMDPGETSWLHARARRLLAPRARFGICTSLAAREMMEHWGLARGRGVLVPHFGSWGAPGEPRGLDERPFDLLVCGTLNQRKNPMFIADVVDRLASSGFRPRVRVVGDGPLRAPLADRFVAAGIEAQFDGYLQQAGIIEAYQSSKLLLFPTLTDTWGLVANEALLCARVTPCRFFARTRANFRNRPSSGP
jgi:glycosyltransferase involved in cell wall biosynthesis